MKWVKCIMLESFLTVFNQMFGIFLLIGVGYALNRLHLMPKEAARICSRMVTLLFLPSLMLHTNLLECHVGSLVDNAGLALCGTLIILASIALSYVLAKFFSPNDRYVQGVYRYGISFPNTGAVGTPLILALFGTYGLFQYNLFWFAAIVLTYSWGVMQLRPVHQKQSVLQTIRDMFNPTLIGTLAGIVLGVLGAKQWMPPIIIDSVGKLAGCYVPVSLIIVGFTAADFRFAEVIGEKKAYIYSAIRLLAFPGVVLAILRALGAEEMMCVIAVLAMACPSGMNVVIFPASYGQDTRAGVSMLLVSSLLALVTVPLVYALAIG